MPFPTALDSIDPARSVDETLARFPAAVRSLNAFGIDTCCGGSASLAEAAAAAGVPLDALLSDMATYAERST